LNLKGKRSRECTLGEDVGFLAKLTKAARGWDLSWERKTK